MQNLSYRGHKIVTPCKALKLTWLIIMGCVVGNAFAQTAPITSSGLNTQVNLSSTPPTGTLQYDITGGTRPGGGPNLFHSFNEFGVPSNHIANFLNETKLPTENILARVTGEHASNIFGTIQTKDFGSANLFLLNPRGFVFGSTAILNVGGSVAFTSADYLKLNDNVRFDAIPNIGTDALLSSEPVASFGFLGSNPGTIEIRGSQLSVQDGQNISLIGGNIAVQSGTPNGKPTQAAQLSSQNGSIFLASASSAGEFNAKTLEPSPNVNGKSFNSYGSLSLAPASSIDIRGTSTVSIRDGQFLLSVNDTVLTTDTGPTSRNTLSLSQESSILTTNSHADHGADIEIVTGTLQMKDSAKIVNRTSGPGDAGNTHIQAHERITLLDSDINSSSFDSGLGAGNAGQIWLSAPTIVLQHGNVISLSQGPGNAGAILMEARALTIGASEPGVGSMISSESIGPGSGGNITIHGLDGPGHRAGDVTILAESTVTSTTSGDGPGGHINISTERMILSNSSSLKANSVALGDAGNIGIDANQSIRISSSSELSSTADDRGNAGQITITTPNLTIDNRGRISTSTTSTGNAGTITIGATSINLLNGSQINSTSSVAGPGAPPPTGSAGTVLVRGLAGRADAVLIDGTQSGIFTNTQGIGAGGNIGLTANSVMLRNGGTLSAETTGISSSATGGSITVTTTNQVMLTNGATISAGSAGPGNAGNIFVNAGQQLEVLDGSSITTQAAKASGGNIDIRAIDRIRFVNSSISTSVLAEDGTGGNIFIDPNVVILEGSQVTARAVTGSGGNITFVTPLFLADSTSVVSASSRFGLDGRVTTRSNLSTAVAMLELKTIQAEVLLQNRCVALAGGEQSTFILTGRNTLPVEPGGWLSSPVSMEHWTGVSPEHASTLMVQRRGSNAWPAMITPKGEAQVLSLRRLTPPGFLVRAFATPSTGCPS
jgi:filamentous hemagglutinin family protein